MTNAPRTITGELLQRKHVPHGPIDEILGMACSPPSTDSSSVSLSEPDPLICHIPLISRVSPQCRECCQRTVSAQTIQCQNDCRKDVLLIDTRTGWGGGGRGGGRTEASQRWLDCLQESEPHQYVRSRRVSGLGVQQLGVANELVVSLGVTL